MDLNEAILNLIQAGEEILNGEHLWDYHDYLDDLDDTSAALAAVATKNAVEELEAAIAQVKLELQKTEQK